MSRSQGRPRDAERSREDAFPLDNEDTVFVPGGYPNPPSPIKEATPLLLPTIPLPSQVSRSPPLAPPPSPFFVPTTYPPSPSDSTRLFNQPVASVPRLAPTGDGPRYQCGPSRSVVSVPIAGTLLALQQPRSSASAPSLKEEPVQHVHDTVSVVPWPEETRQQQPTKDRQGPESPPQSFDDPQPLTPLRRQPGFLNLKVPSSEPPSPLIALKTSPHVGFASPDKTQLEIRLNTPNSSPTPVSVTGGEGLFHRLFTPLLDVFCCCHSQTDTSTVH